MSYINRVVFLVATAGIVSSCAAIDTQRPSMVTQQPSRSSTAPFVPTGIAKEIVRKFKKVSSLRNSAMSYGDGPLLVGGDVFWQKALADDSTPQDTLQNLSLAEVMYGKYIFEAANRSERKVGKITPQPLVIDSPYPSKRKLYKNRKREQTPKLAKNSPRHLKKWALSREQKVDPLQSSSAFNSSTQDARLARIEKLLEADRSEKPSKETVVSSSAQDARLARIEKLLEADRSKKPSKERTIEVKDSIFAKAFVEDTSSYTSKGSDEKGAYLRYHVKRGDSLWLISKHVFKDAELWPYIFDSNRTKISNPHWIYPGQTFDFRSDTNDIATQNKYREQARRWARTRDIRSVPIYQEESGNSSFVNSNFYSDL